MGFAVSTVLSVIAFTYSVYSSYQAARAQKRAKEDAKKRADAAKGFQYVEEGEAKPLGVPFGRNKIGGVRVAFHITSDYQYVAPPVKSVVTSIPYVEKNLEDGDCSISSTTIYKTASTNAWDSFVVSQEDYYNDVGVQFTPKLALMTARLGFTKIANAQATAFSYYLDFKNDGSVTVKTPSSTLLSGTTYGSADTFYFRIQGAKLKFYKNGALLGSWNVTKEPYHIKYAFWSAGAGFTNIVDRGIPGDMTTFACTYKKDDDDTTVDAYELVNTATNWSGTWSIQSRPAGSIGHKYRTRNDSDWDDFPTTFPPGSLIRVPEAPRVDYIYFNKRITGSHTEYNPITGLNETVYEYDEDAEPPKLTALNLTFPTFVQGTYNNLEHDDPGDNRRSYLFVQQAISLPGISQIVNVEVDERPYNSAEFKPGLMLYYYKDGMETCKWMSKNDPTRVNSLFSNSAYLTGCFKLNRDEPQFNGTPDVQSFIDGVKLRYVAYNKTTHQYYEPQKSYTLSYEHYNADGTLESTHTETLTDAIKTYSNNPARVLLEYLRNKQWGRGLPESEIDYESFYKATALCDRVVLPSVAKKGPYWGTNTAPNVGMDRDIRLFECNLTIDTTEKHRDNIDKILGTMYMADLVWSAGKYKLQLTYPRLYSSAVEYQANEVVQVTSGGVLRLFRSKINDNQSNSPLTSPTVWAEDVLAAEITDDDLVLDSEVEIAWPSVENKLNYATVRFLNEDLGFKEDTCSWPNKEPSSGSGDVVYATYLAEDNGRMLEGEFYESGITTPAHALAAAEQRVRFSRHAINYTFKSTMKLFKCEPGDLIGFKSTVFSIPHIILKITSVKAERGGSFTISGINYDAKLLAWNVVDTALGEPLDVYENVALKQARNLKVTAGVGDDKTKFYKLSWTAAADIRVTGYVVKYTTDLIANISTNTVWKDIGSTSNLFMELPALEGEYTFTVVSRDKERRLAPFLDHETGSTWPLIRFDLTTHYLFSKLGDIRFSGRTALKNLSSGRPDVIAIKAGVYTKDGEYTTGLKYRWSIVTNPPETVINKSISNYDDKYGFRTTAAANADATPTLAELGLNLPDAGVTDFGTAGKALVISSDAVVGYAVFMCEIMDTVADNIYREFITITDASDPYRVLLTSVGGDKFLNSQGESIVYPTVYLGKTLVTDLRGWQFRYLLAQADGTPGGFVNWTASTTSGKSVSSNTAYNSGTGQFTLTLGASLAVPSGGLVKVVKNKVARYFKCSATASSGTTVTLVDDEIWPISDITLNQFAGSKCYVCVGSGTGSGEIVMNGLVDTWMSDGWNYQITVKAGDVDYKAIVRVLAYKPTSAELKAAGIF